MLMTMRKILFAAALLFTAGAASAQTAVATAGGEAGTVSFTVGQPFVETAQSDAGSLAPGVQQAYTITTVEVGVGDVAANIALSAYPNPVADRLTLSVADTDKALRYTLTDNNGRTLATSEIADALTEIDMANLVPAVYFLRIDDGNVMVRTFKIVKK